MPSRRQFRALLRAAQAESVPVRLRSALRLLVARVEGDEGSPDLVALVRLLPAVFNREDSAIEQACALAGRLLVARPTR